MVHSPYHILNVWVPGLIELFGESSTSHWSDASARSARWSNAGRLMVFMACKTSARRHKIFLVRVVWDPWLMKLHDLHGSTMNHASCHFWGWETVRLTEVQKSSLKSSQICTMVYYVYIDRKCWQHGFSTRNFSPSNLRIFQRLHWTLRSIRSDNGFSINHDRWLEKSMT